jgi:MYXO-CTERM domain-containing protein
LGDATTISSGTAMTPKLLTGGAFTIGRNITVGANNNALGNADTTFTIGGNTATSSTFSGVATLNQNLSVTQVTGGTTNLTGNITSGSSGTQTLTFNNVGAVAQSTGVIGGGTGTIAVTQAGAGTTTLSGANTYTGATAINAGTAKAGVASVANVSGAFGNNSAVTLANVAGATMDITGFNTQIGSLAGGGATGGNVTLGAATLTTGGADKSGSYAGVISGTGGLTKIGTGTQTLTGANTYSGATNVNAGTLTVSGSLANTSGGTVSSGATFINNGSVSGAYTVDGTLMGSGSFSGAVTVNGALNPGNSPGVQTYSDGLTLGNASTTTMEIGGLERAAIGDIDLTDYDAINVTGGMLTYGGVLNIVSDGLDLTSAANFSETPTVFDLFGISGTGSVNGDFEADNFAVNVDTIGLTGGGTTGIWTGSNVGNTLNYSFNQSTGDLTVTVVPEPGAALLGGLGMLALLRRRRVA